MIETNKLFIGRIWIARESSVYSYNVYPLDQKYRIFYLTKHTFWINKEDAFMDIESKLCYSIDNSCFHHGQRLFVNTKDLKSFRDAFPTTIFPLKLSKKQIMKMCEIFNEAQCNVINDENIQDEQKKYEDKIKKRIFSKNKKRY